jgi:hypothetical protein
MSHQDDYYNGDFLQDIAEKRLLDSGGHALWEALRHEAGAYVDKAYPWATAPAMSHRTG